LLFDRAELLIFIEELVLLWTALEIGSIIVWWVGSGDAEAGSGSTEERSWKRKQTRKHLTFWGAGSGSIFHKTWGRDAEAVKFLWKKH